MARGFDVTLRITGQEEVSRLAARAEGALGRLGEGGARALQRLGTVGASAMQSLAAISPVLTEGAGAARLAANAQRALAASLIQTSNALVRTVHLARRATVALGELAAISLVLPVPLLTSFETPLPLAQHGAIVEQPTLVVAGHGRELIVPARREQRSPEVQAEFERLAAAEGEPITIVVPVRLDGRQIAKAVVRHQRRGAA